MAGGFVCCGVEMDIEEAEVDEAESRQRYNECKPDC
jgi:hypothetical protein